MGYIEPSSNYLGNWSPRESEADPPQKSKAVNSVLLKGLGFRGCMLSRPGYGIATLIEAYSQIPLASWPAHEFFANSRFLAESFSVGITFLNGSDIHQGAI